MRRRQPQRQAPIRRRRTGRLRRPGPRRFGRTRPFRVRSGTPTRRPPPTRFASRVPVRTAAPTRVRRGASRSIRCGRRPPRSSRTSRRPRTIGPVRVRRAGLGTVEAGRGRNGRQRNRSRSRRHPRSRRSFQVRRPGGRPRRRLVVRRRRTSLPRERLPPRKASSGPRPIIGPRRTRTRPWSTLNPGRSSRGPRSTGSRSWTRLHRPLPFGPRMLRRQPQWHLGGWRSRLHQRPTPRVRRIGLQHQGLSGWRRNLLPPPIRVVRRAGLCSRAHPGEPIVGERFRATSRRGPRSLPSRPGSRSAARSPGGRPLSSRRVRTGPPWRPVGMRMGPPQRPVGIRATGVRAPSGPLRSPGRVQGWSDPHPPRRRAGSGSTRQVRPRVRNHRCGGRGPIRRGASRVPGGQGMRRDVMAGPSVPATRAKTWANRKDRDGRRLGARQRWRLLPADRRWLHRRRSHRRQFH